MYQLIARISFSKKEHPLRTVLGLDLDLETDAGLISFVKSQAQDLPVAIL